MAVSDQPLVGDLLSEQVYRRLRQSIIDEELAPGTRLVESEIARNYQISQAPVRDAIKKLAHEGLVTYFKRRGNYVTETSAEEADQARQVRVVIEELAARELAGNLKQEDELALMAAIDEMRRGAQLDDAVRVRSADLAFHRKVCQASGNPFIAKVWAVLEPGLYTPGPFGVGDLRRMSAWHERLLDTLRDGDPDQAAALFASHVGAHGRAHLTTVGGTRQPSLSNAELTLRAALAEGHQAALSGDLLGADGEQRAGCHARDRVKCVVDIA
jgi:DNA-binding GntR family transcriptional regulator